MILFCLLFGPLHALDEKFTGPANVIDKLAFCAVYVSAAAGRDEVLVIFQPFLTARG